MAALVLAIGYLVFRSQKGKPTLGMDGLIGEIGEVRAKLNPSGKVFVHGEYWNAQTQTDGQIDVGERVQIVGYDGMNLKVKRLQEQGFVA
jgi:membrane-bound serine protease (ClpP class)